MNNDQIICGKRECCDIVVQYLICKDKSDGATFYLSRCKNHAIDIRLLNDPDSNISFKTTTENRWLVGYIHST